MDNLYYPNGPIYCRVSEDKKEYFYPDGTPKTIEHYKEGRLHGESTLYWPNGQIKRKCSFIKGVRHGLDQMWDERQNLFDEGCYELGKPVGVHRRFNAKGKLIEQLDYLDQFRFNLRSWDDEGNLQVEALWIDETIYREKIWDRFQNIWVEKEGFWNGKRLVYV